MRTNYLRHLSNTVSQYLSGLCLCMYHSLRTNKFIYLPLKRKPKKVYLTPLFVIGSRTVCTDEYLYYKVKTLVY